MQVQSICHLASTDSDRCTRPDQESFQLTMSSTFKLRYVYKLWLENDYIMETGRKNNFPLDSSLEIGYMDLGHHEGLSPQPSSHISVRDGWMNRCEYSASPLRSLWTDHLYNIILIQLTFGYMPEGLVSKVCCPPTHSLTIKITSKVRRMMVHQGVSK